MHTPHIQTSSHHQAVQISANSSFVRSYFHPNSTTVGSASRRACNAHVHHRSKHRHICQVFVRSYFHPNSTTVGSASRRACNAHVHHRSKLLRRITFHSSAVLQREISPVLFYKEETVQSCFTKRNQSFAIPECNTHHRFSLHDPNLIRAAEFHIIRFSLGSVPTES